MRNLARLLSGLTRGIKIAVDNLMDEVGRNSMEPHNSIITDYKTFEGIMTIKWDKNV